MYGMYVVAVGGVERPFVLAQSSSGHEFKAAAFTGPATALELLLHSFRIKHR